MTDPQHPKAPLIEMAVYTGPRLPAEPRISPPSSLDVGAVQGVAVQFELAQGPGSDLTTISFNKINTPLEGISIAHIQWSSSRQRNPKIR